MPTSPKIYVLDSFALFTFFQAEEPAASMVRDLLQKAERGEVGLFLSIMNLAEIYYITAKKIDHQVAQSIKQDSLNLPLSLVSVSDKQVLDAAEIKSNYNISICDVFLVAVAQELGGVIVTGDPELHEVESFMSILWLT